MPKKPPVKGFRSSLFASTLALLMLLGILLVSNTMQKAREGEGKYSFDEDLCFDITNEKDFDNTWQEGSATGTGAMLYSYRLPASEKNNIKVQTQNVSLKGTVDGYGVSTTTPNIGDVPVIDPLSYYTLHYKMNWTKKKILDLDIVRIDIFLDIAGVTFSDIDFSVTDESFSKTIKLGKVNIGNKTRLNVKVSDLLTINTLVDNEKILIRFQSENGEFIPANTYTIFDMQFYCISEMKVPTLTKLGFYLGLGGIGYIFLGIVVSSEYTIEGIINRVIKLSKGGK